MKYIVKEIKGDYEAQFGKRRVVFIAQNEQGKEAEVSGFFQFVPKIEEALEGEVVPNGKYLNFKFGSKTAPVAPRNDHAIDYVSRNVDATLQGMQRLTSMVQRLVERLETKGVLDADSRPSVLQSPEPTEFDDQPF